MAHFEKRSRMAATAARVWAFHELPDALERLTPPWMRQRLIHKTPGLEVGVRVELEARVGPLRQRIVAEHVEYERGRRFVDEMRQGPFARWRHEHLIEPDGDAAAWLVDRVDYALPLGALGALFGGAYARAQLTRLFDFRHEVTRVWCETA